ncbi:uncharacterized protein J3D65DRAFT_399884 [Phyllosticta citribraziliensis]|uniref:Pre-mRNA splicing factor CLF1 n=1 Tax=Phyllosticta citribraziliensis TaxID=989973 RepID=A0ABR1LQH2_9PEZI
MGVPSPPVAFSDHCSVVHDDTLYVYQPNAFQSISLKEGGKWKSLTNGVSATGAQCVLVTPHGDDSQAALYIVGGTADASLNYPGLQKYTFSTSTWDTITPTDIITSDRQYHGATFLSSTSQILVYAGSQDGSTGKASGTFTINIDAPYSVQSYTSAGAPGLVNPLIMPWNESTALMIGGDVENTAVWTFSAASGWSNLGVYLPAAITDQQTTKVTLVDGSDGSKVLEEYNFATAPNDVTRLALLDAGGAVASSGQAVGARKRDLTIADWPSYNTTFAPNTTRNGASLAQDSSGRTWITGGNTQEPLAVFDEEKNSWMNATAFFSGTSTSSKFHSSTSSSASLTSSTGLSSSASSSLGLASNAVSATAASSSTAAAAASGDGGHNTRLVTVLAATLGSIAGFAFFLVIILVALRCRHDRKKKQVGPAGDEKDRLSFADRGISQMGQTPPAYPGPDKNASMTSLAIMSGKVSDLKGSSGHRGTASDASNAPMVKKPASSPLAYNDPLEMDKMGEKAPAYSTQIEAESSDKAPKDRSRSSGWSRYFANNEATNLQEPYNRDTFLSAGSRNSDLSVTEITTPGTVGVNKSRLNAQMVPPLDLSFTLDGAPLSRVNTASPTISHSREDLSSGMGTPMRAKLERAPSVSSDGSAEGRRMSTLDPEKAWTPMGGSDWNNRVPSSVYPESRPGSQVAADTTSSYYPDGASTIGFPTPGGRANSLYPPSLHPNPPAASDGNRDSTNTVFPGGVPSLPPSDEQRQKAIGNQDMSWLKF